MDFVSPGLLPAGARFFEFFTANIRNKNTRIAYGRAAGQFFSWCDGRGLALGQLEPMIVAAYVEELGQNASKPTEMDKSSV